MPLSITNREKRALSLIAVLIVLGIIGLWLL